MAGKLISIDEWIKQTFAVGSGPSPISVRRWCVKGEVPAKKVGGKWYIELESDHAVDELVYQVLQEAG